VVSDTTNLPSVVPLTVSVVAFVLPFPSGSTVIIEPVTLTPD
jgi:hypothetical protein